MSLGRDRNINDRPKRFENGSLFPDHLVIEVLGPLRADGDDHRVIERLVGFAVATFTAVHVVNVERGVLQARATQLVLCVKAVFPLPVVSAQLLLGQWSAPLKRR